MKKVGIMKTPPGKHKNKRNNKKEGIPQLLLWPKPKGYLFGGKIPIHMFLQAVKQKKISISHST